MAGGCLLVADTGALATVAGNFPQNKKGTLDNEEGPKNNNRCSNSISCFCCLQSSLKEVSRQSQKFSTVVHCEAFGHKVFENWYRNCRKFD